jgi:RimJ/RimL family protein N-acetyltransferase
MPAPERLERDATILRRLTIDDAKVLADTILENVDHLAAWMPWAYDEQLRNASTSLSGQRQRLETTVKGYDDPSGSWDFAICSMDGDIIGTSGIVVRDDGRREIGYWVARAHVGKGHATRAAGLLTDVWREQRGEPRIEIRCDEANRASAAVPPKLGYRLDRVIDHAIEAANETGRMMVWVMDR